MTGACTWRPARSRGAGLLLAVAFQGQHPLLVLSFTLSQMAQRSVLSVFWAIPPHLPGRHGRGRRHRAAALIVEALLVGAEVAGGADAVERGNRPEAGPRVGVGPHAHQVKPIDFLASDQADFARHAARPSAHCFCEGLD